MALRFSAFTHEHELKDAFGISRMSRTSCTSLIVECTNGQYTGFGECSDNPYYESDISQHFTVFQSQWPKVFDIKNSLCSPDRFYAQHILPNISHPFLRCAIDQAYWDFFGKFYKKKNGDILGYKWIQADIPISSFTIGLDAKNIMRDKILNNPWPLYKIKISNDEPYQLLEYLRHYTDSPFYIDANGSLDMDSFVEIIKNHDKINVELIEQPFDSQNQDYLLKDTWPIPIAGDESIRSLEDLEKYRSHYDVANFKLMKSGGMTPMKALIHRAKQLEYKVMMGCMTESNIGISAIAQFLPELDYVDMDGALLLKKPLGTDINFEIGKAVQPSGNGNGIDLIKSSI